MENAVGLWERLPDAQNLLLNLRGHREFSWLFHKSAGLVTMIQINVECTLAFRCLRDEVTFTLNDMRGQPRYNFTILDDPTLSTLLTYGVFIVPVRCF